MEYAKLILNLIDVWFGFVGYFAQILKLCKNSSKNSNIFVFNSIVLSFLGFGKLGAYILYAEQLCANCQVHKTLCMSEKAQKIVFGSPTVNG